MELVVVERVFDPPLEPEQVRQAIRAAPPACYRLYGVRHLRTLLSRDGRRMICEYEAPDAEAVRVANEKVGYPFQRVWTAGLVEAEPVDRSP